MCLTFDVVALNTRLKIGYNRATCRSPWVTIEKKIQI